DILPESPTLLLELAGRYIDANKLIGAEDALSHALKKFPKEPRVYTRLGYVYLLQGKDDLVIPISHKALLLTEFGDHRRDRAYAHLNLAKAYGHKGENAKALDHLRQAKAHGITSFKSLETDDKLKTLRALPAYKTLIGS
ncbi:hypothetical protein KAI87_15960, partial [Myxococcota bacterium]|nr:hypothetical protein [Myxococcota bacterium]